MADVTQAQITDLARRVAFLERMFSVNDSNMTRYQGGHDTFQNWLNAAIQGQVLLFGGLKQQTGAPTTSTVVEFQNNAAGGVFFGCIDLDQTGVGNAIFIGLNKGSFSEVAASEIGGAPHLGLALTCGAFTGVQVDRTGNGGNGAVRIGGSDTIGATQNTNGHLRVFGPICRLIDPPVTPANSAAAGFDGEITWDNNFIYVHSGGSWRRAAIATF